MDDLTIPRTWNDVTAEWMTAALSASHPGVEVERVELVLVDDGTNRRARYASPTARVRDLRRCSSRLPTPITPS